MRSFFKKHIIGNVIIVLILQLLLPSAYAVDKSQFTKFLPHTKQYDFEYIRDVEVDKYENIYMGYME